MRNIGRGFENWNEVEEKQMEGGRQVSCGCVMVPHGHRTFKEPLRSIVQTIIPQATTNHQLHSLSPCSEPSATPHHFISHYTPGTTQALQHFFLSSLALMLI
jgi:hypothetical protein